MNSFETCEKPLVSIVLPVYNAERFLENRLKNILSQTFGNFEVIISADPSRDATIKICREFAKNDNRIRYFEQDRKMGWEWSYKFVTEKAIGKYCVWAAADDRWSSNFLETHVKNLENNQNIVGSIGRIEYFNDNGVIKNQKGFSYKKYPYNKTFSERASYYLRVPSVENLYAIFRTEVLKQSQVSKMFSGDGAIILKILKFGDIFVSNEITLYRYRYGLTHTNNLFQRIKNRNGNGIFGLIFPFVPFTFWCLKNLGIKIFIKNIDFFFRINYDMQRAIILTIIKRIIKH